MVGHSAGGGAGAIEETVAALEAQLRALHQLRPQARLVGDFEASYVHFVRDLRERLHPRGVHDVREVRIEDDLGGLTVAVDLGDRLGCDVYYGYFDEAFEARLFAACLTAGATVIDVGANFGYYSLLAARAAPRGIVYAFEPDPMALTLLRRNVATNGLDERIVIWPLAVANVDGEVDFHLAEESAFSGIRATGRAKTRGTLRLPVRSLDSFAREHNLRAIDALKIDVEGLEGAIVRGAMGLLRSSPDPLVQLEATSKNHPDPAEIDLCDALADLFEDGFHGLVLDLEAEGGLRRIADAADFAEYVDSNAYLVRAGGQTETCLREQVRQHVDRASAIIRSQPLHPTDDRALALYAGIDPALVAAALRERQGMLERVRAEYARLNEMAELLTAQREELRAHAERLVDQIAARRADTESIQHKLDAAREQLDRLHRRVVEQDATIQHLESSLIAARADRDRLQAQCDEQAHEIQRLLAEAIGAER